MKEVENRGQEGAHEDEPGKIPIESLYDSNGELRCISPKEKGEYRLFSYVFDGKGKVGTANVPFMWNKKRDCHYLTVSQLYHINLNFISNVLSAFQIRGQDLLEGSCQNFCNALQLIRTHRAIFQCSHLTIRQGFLQLRRYH